MAARSAKIDARTDADVSAIERIKLKMETFHEENLRPVKMDDLMLISAIAFGITGLETEFSLSLMQLYHGGHLDLPMLIAKYTVNPAKLLKLPKGTLSTGADADVTVFDPDAEWVYDVTESRSKSANTPFHGWTLKGQPILTLVAGKTVWQKDAVACQ